MARLNLTLACGNYDRTQALLDGEIMPEGIELNYIPLGPEEIFWRMLRHREFDVSEMSLAMYLTGRAAGAMPLMAIPVFPSRAFRHSSIYVNAASDIQRPQDLAGRRVGVVEYAITAAVWVRGMLQDEYGVCPEQIQWITGGQEQPNRADKVQLKSSVGVRIERAPAGRYLSEMLVEGDIDALVAARVPTAYTQGGGKVRRLFPDYRAVEQDYFRRTGIFPIMHTLVMKEELYESHPWVAQSLLKAFIEAKTLCYQSIQNPATLRYVLPWMMAEAEEMRELMGEDPWPYGLEPNRKTIEKLASYCYGQGLAPRQAKPEELFAPNTLDSFRL